MHIGHRIESILKSQGRSVSWFARNLNTVRSNVYDIFEREYIDTSLLIKISLLLEYNFFKEISDEVVFEIERKRTK